MFWANKVLSFSAKAADASSSVCAWGQSGEQALSGVWSAVSHTLTQGCLVTSELKRVRVQTGHSAVRSLTLAGRFGQTSEWSLASYK